MANLELAAAFGAADAAKEQDLRGYYPMAARVLAEEVRRLRESEKALVATLRDEMDEGLRLRDLGGARADEGITAMTERIVAENSQLRAALSGGNVIERLRFALQRLADAADTLGVNHFGDDWLSDEVQELQAATRAARLALGPNVAIKRLP